MPCYNDKSEVSDVYRVMFENSMDAILLTDPEGGIFMANPAACSMLRMTESEIIASGRNNTVDLTDPNLPVLLERREREGKASGELRMKKGDGSVFPTWVTSSVFKDSAGQMRTIMIIRDLTEHHKLIKHKTETEKDIQALINSVSDLMILVEPDGTIITANQDLASHIGSNIDEIGELSIVSSIPRDLKQRRRQIIKDIIDNGTSVTNSYSFGGRDYESSIYPVRDDAGEVVRLAITRRDVTEEKRVFDLLQESQLRYKALIEQAGDAFYVHDFNGRFIEVNQQACVSLGYTREEFLSMTVMDIELDFDLPAAQKEWTRIEPDVPFTLLGHQKRKDGKVFPVEVRFGIFFWKGEKLILGLVRDISERVEAERVIKKSEAQFRDIFEHSVVPIWEEDFSLVKQHFDKLMARGVKDFRAYFTKHPDQVAYCASLIRVTGINETSVKFFGKKSKSEVELGLHTYFIEESMPLIKEEMIAFANGNLSFDAVLPLRLSQGHIRHIDLRIIVLPGYEKCLSRVIATWIDVTDRVVYESLLKKVNEELSEMARRIDIVRERERKAISINLHDDLGQKLTALKMELNWLELNCREHNEVHYRFEKMSSLIDDSVKVVQQISSDLRPGILYDFGLVDAIEWHVKEFSRMTGIRSTTDIHTGDSPIDENRSIVLFRILQEATTNVARHANASTMKVSLAVKNNMIVLTVKDNGRGIGGDKVTNYSSLGLQGMRERARSYDGTVTITGEIGKGTTVTATIPVSHTAPDYPGGIIQ